MPVRPRPRRSRTRAVLRPEDAVRAADGQVAAGRRAGLAVVRRLDALVADGGGPAVAIADPLRIVVTGARAAWNGRAPDSWEHVMPWGDPTEEQHRLVAAGHAVRVQVPVVGVWS